MPMCWRARLWNWQGWTLVLAGGVLLTARAHEVSGHATAIGEFDGHGDVGAPKIAGSAAYNAVSQEYTLSAGGVNMWAQRDEFHFVWKRMTGDFILQARVEFLGKGVDPHRKAGWMVRPTQDADAPYVDGVVHGDGLTSLQFRRTSGGDHRADRDPAVKGADVIQLERKGGTLHLLGGEVRRAVHDARRSPTSISATRCYVGLALCSHNADVTERAIFSDVRIVRPAKDGFVPYRDYIGSVLEILDVATRPSAGRPPFRDAVRGAELDARRQRADLQPERPRRRLGRPLPLRPRHAAIDADRHRRRQPQQQRSRPVVRRHDARHQRSEPGAGGRSTIYTVPAGGGTPKRITTQSPSYLHGWSPDGKHLVFTGGRNGEFDIYRSPRTAAAPK